MENTGASTSSSDLRQELTRLQDREALLTHLLCLEREKRVKAEQLVEAEHQACLELGQRLGRERNLLAAARRREGRKQPHEGDRDGALLAKVNDRDDGVSLGMDVNTKDSKNVAADKLSDVGLRLSPPVSSEGSDSGLAMMSPLESDFSAAVFSQLTSDLQDMLKLGSSKDPSLENGDKLSGAREAIEANDAGTLRKCILSVDMDTLSNEGTPLLELASEYGRSGCVRVLLEGGCDPNCRVSSSCGDIASASSEDGQSPLHLAAKYGHLDTLSLLLKYGADPQSQDSHGYTPLFLATREGNVRCAQTLMEHGAKVETLTKLDETMLHAAVLGNSPAILRNLIVQMRITMETVDMSNVINHSDSDGRTALHLAASLGYKECAEVLCARVDVDTVKRDRWNRTPLDVAKLNCKEILLNKESREVVVYVESCGSSPIHTSSSSLMSDSDYRTAIGRISILHHHKLSDLELLVQEAFSQYWNALKVFGNSRSVEEGGAKVGHEPSKNDKLTGVELWDGCKSLQERITKAFTLSKSLVGQNEGGVHTSDDDFKDTYVRWSKDFLKLCRSRASCMDLNEDSILSYRIDSLCWKPGDIPNGAKLKTLFNVFGELERQKGHSSPSRGGECLEGDEGLMEVTVSLKGFREGCLDQLAFDSMIPVHKLKEYADMIEEQKALMIEGAQGSGKTYLALALANHFKYKHGAQGTQVIHVSLHPSFHRDDLFCLLHINGLLVSATTEDKGEELSEQRKVSTVQSRTYILVLDDLSKVSVPDVLAELLTTITYRGEEHPVWIADVFGRDGSLLYPCGHYYLQQNCYFIATRTKSRDKMESTCIDQFPHISLDCRSEPCTGVLRRQLTAKLIHCSLGDLPYNASFLPRLLLWTIDVWLLYNHLVQSLDLPELTCGIKNFIQCPLESKDPEVIINWLSSLWNLQMAPAIESALQSNPRLTLAASPQHSPFSAVHVKSGQTVEQHRYKALMQLLLACTRLVFLPTCPLQLEMKMKMIEQLSSRLEGLVSLDTGSPRREARKNVIEAQTTVGNTAAAGTPPLSSSHVTSRGTPPTPGKSQERRGSLSKHSPSSNKAGNMVSYEDMIRNSPRNTPKLIRNKSTPTTPPLPRKTQPDVATEPVKQVKPVTPMISPKKPPSGDTSTKVTEGVQLREKSDAGRSKTLRKLRSKTVALFSKEGGYSTLPKLFRRGSRSSLVSFSEDEPKKLPHLEDTKSDVQQLGALYDLLSSAARTSRYEDQRSPPPPSPPPEEVDGGNKDNDLDDIFDMMTTINSDRIDEQRSSIPAPTWQNAASADSTDGKPKKKSRMSKKVAKYFLPTGSPFSHGKLRISRSAAASPTNYSMPDLTAEDEAPPASTGSHYYVTHSTSNTPSHSRPRLSSDVYVRGGIDGNSGSTGRNGFKGYEYSSTRSSRSAVEGQRVRSSSFSSHSHHRVDTVRAGSGYPSSILSHNRAYLYDGGAGSYCATDPVARKRALVHSKSHDQDLTTPSPLAASSVPSVSHPPLPPTSPLATTAYSSSYHDTFSYSDSDGSPFISHQHTQSTSTTNTASYCDEVADSSSVFQDSTIHTPSRSRVSDTSLQGVPVSPPSPPPQAQHAALSKAPPKKFQAKSVENLCANEDDIGGALDLFRAASDGEVNQSSSPSPSKVEEENLPSFKPTEVQPPMMANSIATPTKGHTSITMMHCNYHSIYPEESTNSPMVEADFTSPYANRVRSVSAATDTAHFDSGYDSSYRKRRQSETSNTSPMSKKNGGPPSSSSLDYRSRRHSTTTSSDYRYHRNLSNSNSSEGSGSLSQTLSSPMAKVPRSRVPSDTTTLLFSATLGFSELLQTGSRDRLSSQSHHDEIVAEM